ncbi:MAG: hypothetical protein U1F71_19625 [Verrucomicrobiaceae bacterium]
MPTLNPVALGTLKVLLPAVVVADFASDVRIISMLVVDPSALALLVWLKYNQPAPVF